MYLDNNLKGGEIVKKLLIIEDLDYEGGKMEEVGNSLGFETILFNPNKHDHDESLDKVKRLIAESDVILLDSNLGRYVEYEGADLLPFCEGKVVIGTSMRDLFGQEQFSGKCFLVEEDGSDLAKEDLCKILLKYKD